MGLAVSIALEGGLATSEVVQISVASVGPGPDVMALSPLGWLVTIGKAAPSVAAIKAMVCALVAVRWDRPSASTAPLAFCRQKGQAGLVGQP